LPTSKIGGFAVPSTSIVAQKGRLPSSDFAVNGLGLTHSFIRVHLCSSVANTVFAGKKANWPQMNTDEHG
jgi:hypothetical protein